MITTLSYLDITGTPWKGRSGRMLTRKLRLRELNHFPEGEEWNQNCSWSLNWNPPHILLSPISRLPRPCSFSRHTAFKIQKSWDLRTISQLTSHTGIYGHLTHWRLFLLLLHGNNYTLWGSNRTKHIKVLCKKCRSHRSTKKITWYGNNWYLNLKIK